jgi:VHS domain
LEAKDQQPKVTMLALELIDLAMQKCGNPFHVQVGNKEFMNAMVLILNQKGLPPQVSA